MIAWRSSRFLPDTRTCSSWIWAWTLIPVDLMNFTISFAFSDGMPLRMVTTWRTVPFAAGSSFPYSSAFRETPRFANLPARMSMTALRRDSSSECSVSVSFSSVISLTLPLKSKRWRISFIACCTAFDASIMFTSETTSNEFETAIPSPPERGPPAAQEDGEAALTSALPRIELTPLYANCLKSGRSQVAPGPAGPCRTRRELVAHRMGRIGHHAGRIRHGAGRRRRALLHALLALRPLLRLLGAAECEEKRARKHENQRDR